MNDRYRTEQIEAQRRLEADQYKRELERKADMDRRGLNPDGSPKKLDWQGISNADGTLQDKFTMQALGDVKVDPGAYDAVRGEAMRGAGNNSRFTDLQLGRQKQEQMNMAEQLRKQASTAQAQNFSNMAMRGGVSGGMRNQMGKMNVRDQLLQQQQVNRSGVADRMNIYGQDEMARQNSIRDLTQMDASKAQLDLQNRSYQQNVNQFNLTNQLKEVADKRGFNMGQYTEEMKKWAADRMAQAQERAGNGGGGGGGGCFITTAMVDHYGLDDNGIELSTLRWYRDQILAKRKNGERDIKNYYRLAKVVEPRLRKVTDEKVWETIREYINSAVALIDAGMYHTAYEQYRHLIKFVTKQVKGKK